MIKLDQINPKSHRMAEVRSNMLASQSSSYREFTSH